MNTPWMAWVNPFKFLTLDCNAWYHTKAFQHGIFAERTVGDV